MYQLLHGDCRAMLKTLPDCSVDSVVTDPPYELGFMGKGWDKSGIANSVELWTEVLRVLKPGGHLLAFSGSRTYHRMVCAIEDAGFEVRDQIMWVYGSGFPKSMDVSKAIESGGGRPEDIRRMVMGGDYAPSGRGRVNYDHGAASAMNGAAGEWEPATNAARQWQGWGTALKPAHEPIVVARKPLIGTVAANVLAHGTGAINVDGCRVAHSGESTRRTNTAEMGYHGGNLASEYQTGSDAGRFPANLIHDGSDEVVAQFPDSKAGGNVSGKEPSKTGTANCYGEYDRVPFKGHDDGSAARFFYCAKASKKDRGEGNGHPTVKPTDLMRYLCRLITPPGGVVLDPFTGSGSTGKAAMLEGFRFVGCDLSEEYLAIAKARIEAALGADLC